MGWIVPFRSMATLESWLEEFRRIGYPIGDTAKVIQQDGELGADTGLVAVKLTNSSRVTYMQPHHPGAMEWVVTLEPHEAPEVLSSAEVHRLATELSMVSALCVFLETKSRAFVGDDRG